MSLLQLLLKPANRTLLDVVTQLPGLGVGARVTRKAWEPHADSYWEVTKVKPKNEEGTAGKVTQEGGSCGAVRAATGNNSRRR
jgi:hypothetical protein